jgi:hypothetical protein
MTPTGLPAGNGQLEPSHAFDNTEHFVNQGVNTVFTLNSVLSSTKVNEIKVLVSGEKRVRNANGDNPAVNIQGVSVFGQEFFLPGNNDNGKLQAQDNFEYSFAKHDMKFGGDLDAFQDKKDIFAGWSRGEYFYSSLQAFEQRQSCNVNDAASLQNCPSFNQGVGLNNVPLFSAATLRTNYQTGVGVYWQDKWQPNHRLTVTYGLRWDLTRNPQPQSPTPGQQVYVGVGPIGPSGSHLVKPPQTVPDDYDQLGPRVGVAYGLGSQGRTVLRAAWGLYYAETPPIFMPTLGGSKTATLFCTPALMFDCLPPGGFPNLLPSGVPYSVDELCNTDLFCPAITYVDPVFRNPRVSNLSGGVEHQFSQDWSVSAHYVYVHSSRLRTGGFSTTQWARNVIVDHFDQFGRTIVQQSPFGGPAGIDPTIAPGGFGTNELGSFSYGNYHEFTAGIQKRFSGRYQFFANYTLGSNKDNGASERDTDSFFGPQDPFDLRLDYGRNGLDIRDQFKAALVRISGTESC